MAALTLSDVSHYNSNYAGKAGYTPEVPGKVGAPAGAIVQPHPKNEAATSLSAHLKAQAAGTIPTAAQEAHKNHEKTGTIVNTTA